ncbi:p-loop containing nucleoside triphosphate hydrolase protein [Favolaschia claudopus]|uniref:P-loop containing nucleoside triphosphate hydrolase protein n=1 Tax=Favolaschia claudopus TaxID=2862362 RepID=A0AAW0CAQ7_9AGAR
MDRTAEELAIDLVNKLREIPPESRFIVGVAGSPAAGKSSFCHRLLKIINSLLEQAELGAPDIQRTVAILVGLDGWHLSRAELDAFPDPELAHERRGAHWTFDGKGYVEFVKALRLPLSPSTASTEIQVITAPVFLHAIKDPTADAVSIFPHHRLVIIEGLYTYLSIDPWSAASALLDERWFLHVDEAEACQRLIKRHVETGICLNENEARLRAEGNDIPNGRFVEENMLQPTRFIESVQDMEMAHELDL